MVIEIRPIPEHETPGWLESLSSSFLERVDAHRPGALGAIQPNMTRRMEDIRGGTFDLVLTKPEDAWVLSSVREFQVRRIVDIVIGAIVLGTAGVTGAGIVGPAEALAFAAALLLGASMFYCFWLILATGASA